MRSHVPALLSEGEIKKFKSLYMDPEDEPRKKTLEKIIRRNREGEY